MQRQVTRSGQVTIPYKNFTIAPQLQCLRESCETFGNISHWAKIKLPVLCFILSLYQWNRTARRIEWCIILPTWVTEWSCPDLTWGQILTYMVRRALTRQTRWYQNRCSTFKFKDFIVQKPVWRIFEFWPLVTSVLTWAKKGPKWFRNDFSRAFERRFPFCSSMRRNRDRRGGGGCSNTPQQVVENPEALQGAG